MVVQELLATDLLEAWLGRRLLDQLTALAPLEDLAHRFFVGSAESSFLRQSQRLATVRFESLSVLDPELAQELYFRLLAGEATTAELLHLPDVRAGLGEIGSSTHQGPIPLLDLPQPLLQPLLSCRVGSLCPPIQLEERFLLVRLLHRQPAQLDPSILARIEQAFLDQWIATRVEDLVQQLTTQPAGDWPQDLVVALPS